MSSQKLTKTHRHLTPQLDFSTKISVSPRKNNQTPIKKSLLKKQNTQIIPKRGQIFQKPMMVNINQIEKYKNNSKSEINQNKVNQIQYKLQVDRIALKNLNVRQLANKLFLEYEGNPFLVNQVIKTPKTIETPKNNNFIKSHQLKNTQQINTNNQQKLSNNKLITPKEKENLSANQNQQGKVKPKKKDHLVQSISNFTKNIKKFKYEKSEIREIYDDRQMISNRIITEANKAKLCVAQKEIIKAKQVQDLQAMDFNDIILIKENNFFWETFDCKNIFNCLFEETLLNGREQLQKFNFCNSSLVDNFSSLRIPYEKQSSYLSRKLILNNQRINIDRSELLDKNEVSIEIEKLNFSNLLSVASGRMSVQYLSQRINNDEKEEKRRKKAGNLSESEQDQENDVAYADHTENYLLKFENQNEDIKQIMEFVVYPYTKDEQAQEKRCELQRQFYVEEVQKEKLLLTQRILDKQTHLQLKQRQKEILEEYLQIGNRMKKHQNEAERDRAMRILKAHKDRKQKIKVQSFLATMVMKKSLSKQKSPTNLNKTTVLFPTTWK